MNVNVLSSFWGWGGEDDDLYYRVRNRKLNVTKLSPNLGRFKVGSTDCTWEILTPCKKNQVVQINFDELDF